MPFLDSMDIANRACVHLGQTQIATVDENSTKNTALSDAYDKLRPAELRRSLWAFAKRKVILRPISATTFLLDPMAWSSLTTYLPGAVVKDANGMLWTSYLGSNLNNEPGATTVWEQYFGPLTVDAYNSTISYYAGELVYAPGAANGSYVIYRSLQNTNLDDPETATAYAATTTYKIGDVVSSGGSQWRSLLNVNLANTPAEPSADYNTAVTYSSGQSATAADGYKYTSAQSSNIDHEPVTDDGTWWTATSTPAAWTAVPVLHVSSVKWAPLFAGMTVLNFLYPIGSGPANQTSTKNVFRFPSGYLRQVTVDPKESGRTYRDTEVVGKYFLSYSNPLLFGFIADIVTVSDMDSMFCEGLAARLAIATCKQITGDDTLFGDLTSVYQTFMSEARIANAIETEYEEQPEDDYITVRR